MLMDAQDTTASGVAAQAVELEQRFLQLGGDNRYRLGIARNTLALALSMEGRIDEAVQASRDAVETLQAAVNETGTERDRAALAQALQNLGSHLAEQGELDDAVTVTEHARAIMDDLVASDDTWRPALLETLSDLGARYSEIGQAERGLATTAEAVSGYQIDDVAESRRDSELRWGADQLREHPDSIGPRRGGDGSRARGGRDHARRRRPRGG